MLTLFNNPIYHSTFSGLAVFKLLFKNAKFSRNYLFEMTKFKDITREGKIQKLVEKKIAPCFIYVAMAVVTPPCKP